MSRLKYSNTWAKKRRMRPQLSPGSSSICLHGCNLSPELFADFPKLEPLLNMPAPRARCGLNFSFLLSGSERFLTFWPFLTCSHRNLRVQCNQSQLQSIWTGGVVPHVIINPLLDDRAILLAHTLDLVACSSTSKLTGVDLFTMKWTVKDWAEHIANLHCRHDPMNGSSANQETKPPVPSCDFEWLPPLKQAPEISYQMSVRGDVIRREVCRVGFELRNPKPETDSEDLTSPGPILSNLDLT